METLEKNITNKTSGAYDINLLRKSELSVWLDKYDDIFSDFDPSPFSERTLSDDFLHEVKKRIHEKDWGKIQLRLLLPGRLRKKETEAIIIRHLHAHFKYEAITYAKQKKEIIKNGWLLTFSGFIVMAIAAWLTYDAIKKFSISLLRVVAEPAGWFLIWTGLDHIFYRAKNINPELHFYKNMSKADISFLSY